MASEETVGLLSNPEQLPPTWKRVLFLIWASLECLLFCGVMYGWASLVFMLKEEGIYSYLCNGDDGINDTIVFSNGTDVYGCDEQDSEFDLVFTVASGICALMSLGSGQINYMYGTRVTRIISVILFISGSLMLAFVSQELPWLVYPGLTLLGVGGLQLIISSTQIANLFPNHGSAVVGLLNGAFDISADVLLIIKIAFDNGGITRQHSFIFLAGLNITVLFSTFIVYPRWFIPKVKRKREIKNKTNYAGEISNHELSMEASQAQTTRKNSVLSPIFLFHLVWFSLLYLHFTYFVSSLNPWLNHVLKGDKTKVSYFTNVHMYSLLPAIVVAWLAGLVYDGVKKMFRDDQSPLRGKIRASVIPQAITSISAVTVSLLLLSQEEWVLYITFLMVMVFRAFLYATASAFLYTVFPVEQFGILYSTALMFAGATAFLQYALFTWAQETNFNTVNSFLAGLAAFTMIHPIYQYFNSDKNSRKLSYYSKL